MALRLSTKLQVFAKTGFRHFTNGAEGSKLLTIKEVRDLLTEMVGTREEWGKETITAGVQCVMQKVATSQAELPKRRPQDSFTQAVIPLSKSENREKYLLHNKGIRFGRLLEDFDTMAGVICYNHNRDPQLGGNQKSPYAFVTALVDRIEQSPVSTRLSPFQDIFVSGKVTWVGTSSMECTMQMEQEMDGEMQKMITAKYLFVARNPQTSKAGIVSALDPQTPDEIESFRQGEENKKHRQKMGKMSLLKMPPSEEERLIIHDIFLSTVDLSSGTFRTRVKPENSIWMEETTLKSLIICHPEKRNLYNKIFGGFLMMKAYELGWAAGSLYSKTRLGMCKIVDDIVFKKPVEIGDLLFLSAQVVYTRGPDLQVHVHAEVLKKDGSHETTNDFHFTFDSGLPNLPQVVPKTYADMILEALDVDRNASHVPEQEKARCKFVKDMKAMRYLAGKRHYES